MPEPSFQNYRDDPEYTEASGHYLVGEQVLRGREGLRSYLADHTDEASGIAPRTVTRTQQRVLAFTWLGIGGMVIYGLFMLLAAFSPGYRLLDYISLFLLLFGLGFVLVHGIGYANQMIKASWGYSDVRRRAFSSLAAPKIACVIASFNEPSEVLEETVAAVVNLDYPNRQIVILDDSTNDEARKAARDIAARHGIEIRQRTNRRGYKAGATNDFLKECDAPYIAIFDADCMPTHTFLRDVVSIIEENPRLAFVQTPQYYANTAISNVAMASARQQAVFYEYIMEGKSQSRAAFCCGTNVIFRTDALADIGGFDESSVTEDFATSLKLHQKGYDSTYYNQIYGYGLAPETLNAYFVQQSRWALGTTSMILPVFKSFFKGMKTMSMGQWWEYLLSTTYYWIGWVNFFFLWLPVLYIFFDVKPLRVDVFTYMAIFIPYFLFTMNMFYAGMEQRGYRVGEMILGQQIGFACFPIHMTAAVSGLIGLRKPFGVTPKGEGGRMSWFSLWPQLLMLAISGIAFLFGMYKYFWGADRNTAALFINSSWALYDVFMLSGIFWLNRKPLNRTEAKAYFGETLTAPRTLKEDGETIGAPVGGFFGTEARRKEKVGVVRPQRRGWAGNLAFIISLVTLLGLAGVGLTMLSWALNPVYPVNVYLLDRTAGRDYQEHRGLVWTLNFLKVRRQSSFGPDAQPQNGAQTGYNFARDYYGFVPGEASAKDENKTDLVIGGEDRPLPDTLKTPGVLYAADTYGEFVEYDFGREKFVKYRSPARGLSPDDVDAIQSFYNRKGLVVAEWNTIGYPTLPGENISGDALRRGLRQLQAGLKFLQETELPRRRNALAAAQTRKNARDIALFQKQITQTNERIAASQSDLKELTAQVEGAADAEAQRAAQKQMEKMLRVNYAGWYGRYVDDFADENESDYRLYKNLSSSTKKQYPNGLSGPGFVFYRDGPSRIYNPETRQMEDNPFSEPVVITQNELGDGPKNMVAMLHRTTEKGVADDPLLSGVTDAATYRYWFDVVRAQPGARVLSYYKLRVKPAAAQKLKDRGFPAGFLNQKGDDLVEITLPAAVASRDNDKSSGALRSLYLAGDASDYALVSRIGEMFPATGGVMAFLNNGLGSYPERYYWNYYEPMMKNVFSNERLRYSVEDAKQDKVK